MIPVSLPSSRMSTLSVCRSRWTSPSSGTRRVALGADRLDVDRASPRTRSRVRSGVVLRPPVLADRQRVDHELAPWAQVGRRPADRRCRPRRRRTRSSVSTTAWRPVGAPTGPAAPAARESVQPSTARTNGYSGTGTPRTRARRARAGAPRSGRPRSRRRTTSEPRASRRAPSRTMHPGTRHPRRERRARSPARAAVRDSRRRRLASTTVTFSHRERSSAAAGSSPASLSRRSNLLRTPSQTPDSSNRTVMTCSMYGAATRRCSR